ncbi:MAG: cupin domain-containing protein [Anaerolineaceae bacterium]|nr:cupin domain-containing protein [Anaerolineaceae bacterium]
MTENMKPYVLQADEGIGSDSSLKATVASTGGHFTLIESDTDGGAPMHIHSREDEYFYVVEGTITVTCGDQVFEVGPRGFVFLPRNIPHAWDVIGQRATVLMMTVPARLDEFLAEFHAAASQEVKDKISQKYGIIWVRD